MRPLPSAYEQENPRQDAGRLAGRDVQPALVSVIVIFLNAERFISEAIDSVIGQSYSTWELILVDDGSADGSSTIARAYADRRSNITYVEHPGHGNLGTGPSRNLGITQARGNYVAFLDSDDVWLPRKLEEQVALLDQEPDVGMIYGVSEIWYGWSGNASDLARDHVQKLGLPSGERIAATDMIMSLFVTQSATVPSICSVLLRSDAIGDGDWFPHEFRGPYEDQALYARFITAGPVIGYDRCWDRYRQHGSSLTATIGGAGQAYRARLRFIQWLIRFLARERMLSVRLRLGLWREATRCRFGALLSQRQRSGGLRRLAAHGNEE